MKTISLSAEISNVALETVGRPLPPDQLLGKVKGILSSRPDILGNFTGSRSRRKDLGSDLSLNEYNLDYENHSLHLELIRYQPRNEWQVKGFRFV